MSDKTALGDRMKVNYEDRTRFYLPRRTHVIIRLDGKAFHTYTRGLVEPFDERLAQSFWTATANTMSNIQGCAFAYHQSDEVSILITDFATIKTEAPFDYNIQKLASISASIMTAHFNKVIQNRFGLKIDTLAYFDSRVFSIPDRVEVYNYFLWRQKDCVRNSIQGLGQFYFSQAQLHKLNIDAVQEKLFQEKQVNWATALPNWARNGTIVFPDGITWHLPNTISTFKNMFLDSIPVRQD